MYAVSLYTELKSIFFCKNSKSGYCVVCRTISTLFMQGVLFSIVEKPASHMIVQGRLVPVSDGLHSLVRPLQCQDIHPDEHIVAFLDGIELDDAQLGYGDALCACHMADAQA